MESQPTLFAEASLASRLQSLPPLTAREADWLAKTAVYLKRWSGSFEIADPDGPLLKILWVSRRGKVKSREAWRALATQSPDPNSRLLILAHLIHGGVCSLLPTLTARDWKSPGRADHPRLTATRGEPLPETFGEKLSPALGEWMMGFPSGWLNLGR